MPDWDGLDDDGNQGAASGRTSDGSGVTFHPLTDAALDQHYADLANQHDPDGAPGVLGTFQRLPPDGVTDRWRYTPPNIPGPPATDGNGNPCSAWLVSRPAGQAPGGKASPSAAGPPSATPSVSQVEPLTVWGHHNLMDRLADVGGKVWAAPNTILGLLAAGAGYAAGKVMGTNPQFHLGDNAIQMTGFPIGEGAATLGNVEIYGGMSTPKTIGYHYVDGLPDMTIDAHEYPHTRQSQALGPFYFPAWAALGMMSKDNPLERAADYAGAGQGGPFSHLDQGPVKIFGLKIR